ncbi:hypothetical protein BB560_001238 [Smittium megazygosporum]|uniref:STAS domain-containing protein n=1 Tax=Smittium megazygosporum TaxID=133381 RepID=A0A2T9ZI43_9FUNG|nr:hypothetical protein BB560_001238 [Smittium megazygosporum]
MSSRAHNNSIWSFSLDSHDDEFGPTSLSSLSFFPNRYPEQNRSLRNYQELIKDSEAIHSKSIYLNSLSYQEPPTSSTGAKPNASSPLNPFKDRRSSLDVPQASTSETPQKSGLLSLMINDDSPSSTSSRAKTDNKSSSIPATESTFLLENYIPSDDTFPISSVPSNATPIKPQSKLSFSELRPSALTYDSFPTPSNDFGSTLPSPNTSFNKTYFEHSKLQLFKRKGAVLFDVISWPMQYVPAVFLGLIFNLLDGISYGLITFPLSVPVYEHMGPVGLSMFFVRCNIILETVGASNEKRVIATTLMSYALSSIMTGLFFLVLGALRIGKLIDFFPRHILVGCIGGVGFFLIETGFEVMTSIPFSFSFKTLLKYLEFDNAVLWGSSLSLSILLRILGLKFKGPMLVPFFCMMIPIVFYAIVFVFNIPIDVLRSSGWVFPEARSDVPFYYYLSLFDFSNTDWTAVLRTVPTMIGLSFFGILHVPINVPALAVSIGMNKIDTDRELVAHAISNIASGVFGSFQNYLCYSNSLLFIKCGGDSRLASLMLAGVTVVIMVSGPAMLGYIPTTVVGVLIFYLGLELMKEALVDSWDVANSFEYLTIVMIVLTMAFVGFNEGIILGIVLACAFFILIYSKRSVIWKSSNGLSARSTVRRLYRHKLYLDQVCQQIHVMRLRGYMFFGTINSVEDSILRLLSARQWDNSPIRFLVLDFAFVTGMDFSAGEAFIRLRRVLSLKQIHLVICGVEPNSEVSKALVSFGILNFSESGVPSHQSPENNGSAAEQNYIHAFSGLNAALEWCENYLLEYYIEFIGSLKKNDITMNIAPAPKPINKKIDEFISEDFYGSSPRLNMLTKASKLTVDHQSLTSEGGAEGVGPTPKNIHPAIVLLSHALQKENKHLSFEKFVFLAPYFKELRLKPGEYLWRKNNAPKGLFLVQSGMLSASITSFSQTLVYDTSSDESSSEVTDENAFESIMGGTIFGELQLLTGRNYNNTVVAKTETRLYLLSAEDFEQLTQKEPEKILELVRLLLMYTDQYITSVSSLVY